ncbi:phosphomannomutase/phosphoglucomutase, partial [candidate division KSB1 bacterium]|nr:phosphomannomutase/phosphoglucomutase [candidate division KSB1 bacterium]
EKGDFESGIGKEAVAEIIPAYLDMLKSKLKFNKKLKIVIDAGNGTASLIAPKFFEDMGLEVVRLYCEPDGRFPNHLPDPTVPKYVVDLQKKVLEVNADAGIGYDGDSDRIGTIDNKGRQIFADRLLALFSRDVLTRHPGGQIVFDVKCSQALPEYIQKYGGQPVMYKTGHSLLKAKMKEIHSPLAGEMSGHMFFADDYFGYDDAIYASGRLLQMIANSDKTLADFADEIPPFVSTPEIRVDTTDEAKFKIVEELVTYFKSKYEVNDIDGARVLFGDGWGLVRASNTQPVLVLRFEARTEKQLEDIQTIFRNKLKEFPEVFLKDDDF